MKLPADHLEALALICGDDQELADIRAVTDEWLERRYPSLTEAQRLAMAEAIFKEAITDLKRSAPDIVEGVLERYAALPPSRKAKPIAAQSS